MRDDMVVLDKTEYSDLALGHPPCSCKTVEMVGLKVHVFGLEEIQGSQLPIACVVGLPLMLRVWANAYEAGYAR